MMLYGLIHSSASAALGFQNSNGSMPEGHNGPYVDPETPVRNTAHWCITFLKAYDISKDKRFLTAAIECGDYLLSDEARPMNAVFFCRKNPEKDFANGLVGQAWAIEALVALYENTKKKEYIDTATAVFLQHPYIKKHKAWIRLNVDGSYNGFDKTFNHQLWFAAAGGLLAPFNKEIHKQTVGFMDHLGSHLSLYQDGCIKHAGWFLCATPIDFVFCAGRFMINLPKRNYLKMKSVGYHGFNLFGFALLKKAFPSHPFWKSKKLAKALKYAKSQKFKTEIPKSKYGFPYNPPGFEVAFALETFKMADEKEIAEWVSWQINQCYDFDQNLMILGGTKDQKTAAARIYEASRLRSYPITSFGKAQ